jgi:hypothetical protein
MRKSKRKYPLRAQTSPEMNNILLLHSEWLDKEGLSKKAKECREQAVKFKERGCDERQIKRNINRQVQSRHS